MLTFLRKIYKYSPVLLIVIFFLAFFPSEKAYSDDHAHLLSSYTVTLGKGEHVFIRDLILNSGLSDTPAYESENEKIASVSEDGEIIAKKVGNTIITVSDETGNYSAFAVNVMKAPGKIRLNAKKVSLTKNKSAKLNAILSSNSSSTITFSSDNDAVAKVSSTGLITAVSEGTCKITAQTYNGKSKTCTVTVYPITRVAITFDDGPGKYTEKLLDFFKENGIKATFFMVGTCVEKYPDVVKRIYDEGHELGNHTYNHPVLTKLSEKKMKSEISKTTKLIKKACGAKPTLLRPPYGSYNKTLLSATKLPLVTWSVDTLDWKYRDAKYVKKTIINSAFDGSIILLHDIHETSVNGAIAAIKVLQKRGYEFVTVTELLSESGMVPESGTVYNKAKR